ETIREEVKVVHVEVPVRVFYKGKPVDNLTIDDFELYEDKKLQTISSFTVVKKSIKIKDSTNAPSRFFVLVFRVTNYNKEFQDGVKHLFDNILDKNDGLLILANDESMTIDNLGNKEEALSRLNKLLSEQGQLARGQMNSYLKRIEQELGMNKFKVSLSQANYGNIQDFLRKYLTTWKEYKERYLMPNLGRYYAFARHLETVKREKWVINFFQMETLPDIVMTNEIRRMLNNFIDSLLESTNAEQVSYGRILRTLAAEINEESNIKLTFPVEDVSRLFYKVDAVFHTIFMTTTFGLEVKDFENSKIIKDMMDCLGDITRSSGGTLEAANDIQPAIDKIIAGESLYYRLTYSPQNPQKPGKIKIKTGNKKYDVRYDDNFRADYLKEYIEKQPPRDQTPDVKVKNLDFKNKNLSLAVADFLVKETGKGTLGSIGINICITDGSGAKVFDQGKTLVSQKNMVTISIPFKDMKPGKYNIVVDVKDLLTGKCGREFTQAVIE
ncbi:MAG: hypothetical protein L0Y73_01920, partial [Candidatus Aminicenantes bacterium]|nr:hypothetical protein [Candidatus Aminicenantes bacterium]